MKSFKFALVLLFVFAFASFSGTEHSAAASNSKCNNLEASHNLALQLRLNKAVKNLGLNKAKLSKKLSVYVADISNPTTTYTASVNENNMMYAASMPKIAIALGFMERVEQGTLVLNKKNSKLLTRMIRNSNNKAATALLNKVGRTYLANLLQSKRYKFYDKSKNGGLWVGKEYGRGSAFRRDPLHNISHGATTYQTARFYCMLANNQLVNDKTPIDGLTRQQLKNRNKSEKFLKGRTLNRVLKEAFSKPAINHKIVKAIGAKKVEARKSGSWRQFHADSAVIKSGHKKYIVTIIAESPNGGKWIEKLAKRIDKMVTEVDYVGTPSTNPGSKPTGQNSRSS